ncbi:MAG: hypothetical protein IJK30_01570 [Ruminococcus sp.]|nr:hypothetical protein [Ruminococcus sp.]
MGLDLYIEAKITEKATGRCISVPNTKEIKDYWFKYDDPDEDHKHFCILWMCGQKAAAVRNSWIDIINRYMNTNYNYNDFRIPFPQTALREMCSCLFSYGITPEDNRFLISVENGYWDKIQRNEQNNIPYEEAKEYPSWNECADDEHEFLIKANDLRNFIYEIERIHYENKYEPLEADHCDGLWRGGSLRLPDDFILLEDDRRKFSEDPQAYEWSFRIFNSY